MKNDDNRAAALITFLGDVDGDTRLDATDRAWLTAYLTKLGSAPTNRRDDNRMLQILRKLFSRANAGVR